MSTTIFLVSWEVCQELPIFVRNPVHINVVFSLKINKHIIFLVSVRFLEQLSKPWTFTFFTSAIISSFWERLRLKPVIIKLEKREANNNTKLTLGFLCKFDPSACNPHFWVLILMNFYIFSVRVEWNLEIFGPPPKLNFFYGEDFLLMKVETRLCCWYLFHQR